MLTKPQLKFLRKECNQLKALYQIGKNELSDTNVSLLVNGLKAKELIKVQVLQSVEEDIEELALKVAVKTNADLVETKGRTFVLFKRNVNNPIVVFPK